MSRFPFATNLKIIDDYAHDVDHYFFDFSERSLDDIVSIAAQIANMTRLQSLDLSKVDLNTRLLQIITNHQTTTLRTKALSVESDYEDDNDQFIANIAAFKHLECLKVEIDDDSFAEWDIESIIKICSNLKGLDFNDNGHGIEVRILQQIGHRLQYLKLNRANTVKGINFSDLRHFKQGKHCSDNVLGDVLRTAVNLEKVKMNGNMDSNHSIQEILTKCKQLKYLEIVAIDAGCVLDALMRSLPHAKFAHTEPVKIRINTTTSFAAVLKDSEYTHWHIRSLKWITHLLSRNTVKHWMLILHIKHSKKIKERSFINDLCRSLRSDILNIEVFQDNNDHIVLMTHPDSEICGWRESWLMNS